MLVVQIDGIICGSTIEKLCNEFSNVMKNEFEILHVDELNYFLELQIK